MCGAALCSASKPLRRKHRKLRHQRIVATINGGADQRRSQRLWSQTEIRSEQGANFYNRRQRKRNTKETLTSSRLKKEEDIFTLNNLYLYIIKSKDIIIYKNILIK